MTSSLYCCGCRADVSARLVDGREVYPHRSDLADLPFWKCDACGNFVGCHHKSAERTRPLGCIPTPDLKRARREIHRLLDSIWTEGWMSRREVYSAISDDIGHEYHTGDLRSLDEARKVWLIVNDLAQQCSSAEDTRSRSRSQRT